MGLAYSNDSYNNENTINNTASNYNNISEMPEYSGQIYVTINNNIPYFNEADYTVEAFENYSDLDELGRCGTAFANICKETMPPEGDARGDISL